MVAVMAAIRLPLSSNCRDSWNKIIVKGCRIIQETILKHKKKRYMSGDKLSLLYMAHMHDCIINEFFYPVEPPLAMCRDGRL